jgi:protein-arginine kinase activator protein McsA
MRTTICNKCESEIKSGIITDNNTTFPPYYTIEINEFTGEGRLCGTKKYDLCEKCYKEFKEFIDTKKVKVKAYGGYSYSKDNKNYHIDSIKGQTVRGYKSNYIEDPYKTQNYVAGENMKIDSKVPKNSIQIGYGLNDIKSIMKSGNVYVHTTKVYNKLQKYFWKKLFGVEILEVSKDEKDN